jgi:hypothetical protein
MFDFALSQFCLAREINAKCVTVWPTLFDHYRPAGANDKDSDRRDRGGSVRKHGTADNIIFPVKVGLKNFVESNQFYESQWPDQTLWPKIDPVVDKLPMGEGIVLSKEEFQGVLAPG